MDRVVDIIIRNVELRNFGVHYRRRRNKSEGKASALSLV